MFWLEFWKERMQSKVVVELVAEEKKKKKRINPYIKFDLLKKNVLCA